MRLKRPHIPVRVRLQVIACQLLQRGALQSVLTAAARCSNDRARLAYLLSVFAKEDCHLDHDPPLCLREIIDAEKGIYDPPANDPNFLIYRTAEDHRIKTFVHGDGAQLSDAGKRRKEIRRIKKGQTRIALDAGECLPRRLQSANRWPPRGSRPFRRAP